MGEKIFQRNYCSYVFLLPVDSNSLRYEKTNTMFIDLFFHTGTALFLFGFCLGFVSSFQRQSSG